MNGAVGARLPVDALDVAVAGGEHLRRDVVGAEVGGAQDLAVEAAGSWASAGSPVSPVVM